MISVFQEPARRCKRPGFDPWVGKIPWRRKWQPSPEFLPGKAYGQRTWQATICGVVKSPGVAESPRVTES